MESIIEEIREERTYQQRKWGDAFDNRNTPNDWVAYIALYLGRAVTLPWKRDHFRTALVKVATLCVAAIETLDRNDGLAARHYDQADEQGRAL